MKYVICFVSWAALLCSASAADHPNIILILADDLGYSDLGCYGGEIDTPSIDALAAGGVRLTQFYNSARCCPTRASLVTGLYPSQAGIGDFTTPNPSPKRGPGYLGRLNDQCVTLAEVLKPAGYGCYYVGKWHMHEETGPIKRGFDEFYGYTRGHSHDQYDADYYIRLPEGREKEIDPPRDQYYATDVFNQYAVEFIRQGQASGQPWFIFLGHSSPHFPVQAPADRADKYDEVYLRGWDSLREERYERMKALGLIDGDHWQWTPRSIVPVDREDIANGFPGQPNPAWDSLNEDRQRDLARRMAVYAAMVESVDQGVGQIVQHLKQTGDLDNTLILFLSDNGACYEWGPFGFDGPSRRGTTVLHVGDDLRKIGGPGTHQSYGSAWANLGNTPFRLYKHFTHEGGICSPLIVHWPKGIGRPNRWIRDPAHVMDIMPTLLEATGAAYPEKRNGHVVTPMEGTSLLPVMRGQRLPKRSMGFDHQGARALREGDWKLVWSKHMPHDIEWELYNLAEDRCETQDLAAKHPDRVQAMAAQWEQWARRVQVIYEPPTAPETPQAAKKTLPPESPETPEIANRSLTITGRVRTSSGDGVIVAQGGREQGYAVHLLDGHLAFDVRVNGAVTRIAARRTAPNEFDFEARLTADQLLLLLNGQQVAAAASPGLIPVQPKDGLNIGRDELSAAGDYQAPNPLDGIITEVKVTTGPAGKNTTQFPPSAFIQQKTDRKPGPVMDAETIRAGLKSHDRALYIKAGWIRDPYITLGPDDFYYLTGTQPREGDPREAADPYNIGLGDESIVGDQVRLWRSRDLIEWETLGPIFTVDDTVKARSGANIPRRLIWAPEVHWLPEFGDNGRWALLHCPASHSSLALSAGRELKGPWTHPLGDQLGERHDPSLFRDDDGTWYLLWANTLIAPLSSDFSRYTAEPVRIDPAGSRTNALGETKSVIGHEGATMIEVGGKYVHLGTAWSTDQGRKGSYNLYYCVADKITGPYGPRKFAGRFLGHGTPFQTRDGKWWCTAFFNANVPPLPREGIESRDLSENAQTINEQGVTIVPLDVRVLDDGNIFLRAKDPAYASPGPDEVQKFDLEDP